MICDVLYGLLFSQSKYILRWAKLHAPMATHQTPHAGSPRTSDMVNIMMMGVYVITYYVDDDDDVCFCTPSKPHKVIDAMARR